MANSYATLTFALPEDNESNYLRIYSSATETGFYSQVGSDISYQYGVTTYQFEDINPTVWYKIRFYNSSENLSGPYSNPVYGGDWDTNTSPFLAVSTTSDGANYATIDDVRTFSGLLSSDVADSRISSGLRRSRAIVDIKTSEMGIDRFTSTFQNKVAKRKYNATLQIVKESEINYCLGMIYRGMVDDIIMQGIRGEDPGGTISIGQTSINTNSAGAGPDSYKQLERLSLLYTQRATVLLSMIQPSSIAISWQEPGIRAGRYYPKFLWPPRLRGYSE